jgi:hypothetical protein
MTLESMVHLDCHPQLLIPVLHLAQLRFEIICKLQEEEVRVLVGLIEMVNYGYLEDMDMLLLNVVSLCIRLSNNSCIALGYLNDLWIYDPSNSMWTWVYGSNTRNAQTSYNVRTIFLLYIS